MWDSASSHADKLFRLEKQNETFYFYTMKGIRRRIPDRSTATFLQLQTGADGGKNNTTSNPILISEADITTIPLDPSISAYPSRRSGSLLQSTGEIFVMEEGHRRAIGHSVLETH
jgi:hypothetical protein